MTNQANRFPFLLLALALLGACSSSDKPPYSPEESMAMVALPEGYRLELVASEPDIVDPVAINFDEKGRMYVVEMIDYPLNLEPLGQVKRLEDKDGDGVYETATLFADKIQFPTGVMRWRDGILVTSAPDLLYFEDADDDGKADKREVLLTGFAATNPQLRVNGPRYGIDNWIYVNYPRLVNARKFQKEFGDGGSPLTFPGHPGAPQLDVRAEDLRIRPDEPKVEALGNGSQFGNSFDQWGNRFTVYNNDYLRHIVIENRYLESNPYLAVSKSYRSVSGLDHAAEIYPITEDPLVIHDSQIGHFTSACGMSIYTGGILPDEFDGNALTCEPVNNLIRRSRVKPEGGSFLATPAYEGKEFLASRDAWFRPVFTTTGPDGGLYIADYYRFTVEHPEFVPPELSKQIEFEARHKLGRIYRLVHESSKPWPKVDLSAASTAELVQNLEHPGSWQRLESQRLLLDRKDPAAIEPLRAMAALESAPVARIHALWSLDGLDALENAEILAALQDTNPEVRRQAIRMVETRLPDAELSKALLGMGEEKNSRVQFQLALTLQLHDNGIPAKASFPIVRDIVAQHIDDDWFRIAALTGAQDIAGQWYSSLIGDPQFAGAASDGKADLIQRTASILGAKKDVAGMAAVLRTVSGASKPEQSWWRIASLEGLGAGIDQASSADLKLGAGEPLLLNLLAKSSPDIAQAALEIAWRVNLTSGSALDRLVDAKTKVAFEADAEIDERRAAAGVMALRLNQETTDKLTELLAPQQPTEVRLAAMRALTNSDDNALAPKLLERWRELSAPVRNAALGWFMNDRDRIFALIDAASSGDIQAWSLGPNTMRVLERHPDLEIRDRAQELAAQAKGEDRQAVYDSYLPSIRAEGDAERGREVFRDQCADCHKVEDMGHPLGPDLLSVTTRYKEVLLADILMPNAAVETGFEEYMVETKDGRMLTGVLAKETPASVTIRQAKGVEDTILRSNMETMYSLSVSPMPEGFEDEISVDAMADLLAFIKSLRELTDMLRRALLFTAMALAVAAPSSAEGFRVGRAKTVITPPAGMPMAGSYRLRLSEGVHDDLHAKALVMERDGVRVALVACDLVAVSDGIVSDARKIIERSSGIPAENVMISATHTHSGPFIPGRGSFDDEFGRNMPVVAKFREQLPQQIAAAVALAAADLQPARVFAGRGEEGSVAFNRRFLMKDGSIRTNPGSNNPDIVRPVGPIDPTVAVALFVSDDEKQTPLATYVNYPLHVAVAGGMQFSADFPGVIAELLSRVKGEQMLTLFTAGACGNINHLNVHNYREHPSRQPGANRIGVILAAEILKTYAELEEIQPNALQVSSRVLDLPKIELSDAEIADARRVAAMAGTDNDPGTRPLAQAFARLDIIGRNGQPFQKEVQVISLGDAMAWAALPGEIFVEHGLRLKTMSPFRHTMLVELANGWISYVPDRKAMPEGGYEVISARCGSGCGEAMVDAAVEMLIDDHAKTLPMTGLSLKR